MKKPERKDPDFIIFLVVIILLGFGLVMVFSASIVPANYRGDIYYYLRRQGVWAILGLMGLFFMTRFNYWKIKKLIIPIIVLNFVLLLLVYVPGVGWTINNAQRWISIGGQVFQPSEYTKMALIIFSAWYLSKPEVKMSNFFKSSMIPLAAMGISFILILDQPDLGTAVAIAAATFLIIFVAGMPLWQIGIMGLIGGPVGYYLAMSKPYRRERILSFMDPWADPLGSGYQIIQSLLALGPGGLLGAGIGHSRQKFLYLPEPQNDFIFAIIGEELGFIGTFTVLLLFFILVWRGFKVALHAPDTFGSLLAVGITGMIGLQAILNIGVVSGSLPVTGINLPLISAGGSSLFFTLTSIGILLNISRFTKI
jgi:cell division protein FtsW